MKTRWGWFFAWCGGWLLCALAGGFLRNAGDPAQFPLFEAARRPPLPLETYNPGRQSFRALWRWDSLNAGDFQPVVQAAKRRRAGKPLYQPEELRQGRASFVYTPFTALLVAPTLLAGWSAERTADAASLANHAFALIGFALLFRLVFAGRSWDWRDVLAFALPCLAFYPMANALYLTQCGVWIFFCAALSFSALHAGHALLGGICLGLAASIKPHLALVPIALLCVPGFPRRFIAATFVTGALTGLLSVLYAGWGTVVGYFSETLPQLSAGYSYFQNQSFNGLLLRGFTEQKAEVFDLATPVAWVQRASSALGLALLAGVTALCRRGRAARAPLDDELVYAALFSAVVVASPVCWIHHLILLLFPIGIAARALALRGEPGALGGLLLAGLLLVGSLFDASRVPNGWPSVFTNLEFAGALLVLSVLLALRRPTTPHAAA